MTGAHAEPDVGIAGVTAVVGVLATEQERGEEQRDSEGDGDEIDGGQWWPLVFRCNDCEHRCRLLQEFPTVTFR